MTLGRRVRPPRSPPCEAKAQTTQLYSGEVRDTPRSGRWEPQWNAAPGSSRRTRVRRRKPRASRVPTARRTGLPSPSRARRSRGRALMQEHRRAGHPRPIPWPPLLEAPAVDKSGPECTSVGTSRTSRPHEIALQRSADWAQYLTGRIRTLTAKSLANLSTHPLLTRSPPLEQYCNHLCAYLVTPSVGQ
jgi:hypothetical protein